MTPPPQGASQSFAGEPNEPTYASPRRTDLRAPARRRLRRRPVRPLRCPSAGRPLRRSAQPRGKGRVLRRHRELRAGGPRRDREGARPGRRPQRRRPGHRARPDGGPHRAGHDRARDDRRAVGARDADRRHRGRRPRLDRQRARRGPRRDRQRRLLRHARAREAGTALGPLHRHHRGQGRLVHLQGDGPGRREHRFRQRRAAREVHRVPSRRRIYDLGLVAANISPRSCGGRPMPVLLLALALAMAAGPMRPAEDPRALVREATRAVETGSAGPLRALWQARVEQDPIDRPALLGLGTLARLTYDYPAAEALYRRLSGPGSVLSDRFTAYAHLGQAWALEERGFSNGAEAEFAAAREAARRARDSAAEAEALIALSFVRGRVTGVTSGLLLLDRARRLLPEDALDLESHRLSHGAVLRGAAGSPQAMADAEASIAIARRAGDLRAEAQGLRAAGKVQNFRGHYPEAVAWYRQAEAVFRKAHDATWLAVTLTDRAGTQLEQGDLGEAMEALRAGLAAAEASHNLFAVAGAHTGFADIAMHVNDLPSAAEHLNRAVAMYEAQGDPSSTTIPRRYLAFLSLAAGRPEEARRQVLEILEFYRSTREAPDVFELHRMLAAIAMRERDWVAAERALGDAAALARRLRLPRWSDQLKLDAGLLALFRGDLAAAGSWLRAYLETVDASQPISRSETRLRLAEIHARRGELAAAESEAIAAWDELDRWRTKLGDRELRLLAFQTSPAELKTPLIGKSGQDASVARLLGLLAAGGRVASAFELAERRRARELMDAVLQAEALRAGSASTKAAGLQIARPITAAALAASIPDERTALLEFVAGSEESPATLFVVRRAGVVAHALPILNSWSGQVTRFAALLEGGADPGELARGLGRALLDEAVGELGAEVTRLVVVPDGALHRMPWDALRLANGSRLVERYSVTLAPSAAVVSALWRRARDPGAVPGPVRGGASHALGLRRDRWTAAARGIRARGRVGRALRPGGRGPAARDRERRLPPARRPRALPRPALRHARAGGRAHRGPHRAGAGSRRGRERLHQPGRVGCPEARCGSGGALGLPHRARRAGGGRRSPGTHRPAPAGRRAGSGRDELADRRSGHGRLRARVLRRARARSAGGRRLANGEAGCARAWREAERVGGLHGRRRPAGQGRAAATSIAREQARGPARRAAPGCRSGGGGLLRPDAQAAHHRGTPIAGGGDGPDPPAVGGARNQAGIVAQGQRRLRGLLGQHDRALPVEHFQLVSSRAGHRSPGERDRRSRRDLGRRPEQEDHVRGAALDVRGFARPELLPGHDDQQDRGRERHRSHGSPGRALEQAQHRRPGAFRPGAGLLDRPQQIELGAAGGAAHHVIDRLEPPLLRTLPPQHREQRLGRRAALPPTPAAGREHALVCLAQPLVGQAVGSHEIPISARRSRKSASPR